MNVAMLGGSYRSYAGGRYRGLGEDDAPAVDGNTDSTRANNVTDFLKYIVDSAKDLGKTAIEKKTTTPEDTPEPSFFDKNAPLLIGGVAVVGVLILVAGSKKRRRR